MLNLVFLFLVTSMPFTASVLANFGDTFQGVALYAAVVAAIGLVRTAIWHHATDHHRLVDADLPDELIRNEMRIGLLTVGVFIASIGVAWFNPNLAQFFWIGSVLMTYPIRSRVGARESEKVENEK